MEVSGTRESLSIRRAPSSWVLEILSSTGSSVTQAITHHSSSGLPSLQFFLA
jgi:hypothetical protein